MTTTTKKLFHQLPPGLQASVKQWRSFASRAPGLLQPAKLARSLIYHTGAFALSGGKYDGVHLGSGGLRIAGFLNLDADLFIDCDIVARSERLKLPRNSVGCIYGSHLFEHIARRRMPGVLKNWFDVLRPGGKLYLCVPDLEVLARLYLEALANTSTPEARERLDLIVRVIYGGQTDGFDFHFFGYSLATLRVWLEATGFTDIRRFDRAKLDFAPFKDGGYAQIDGTLISLNVAATKPLA